MPAPAMVICMVSLQAFFIVMHHNKCVGGRTLGLTRAGSAHGKSGVVCSPLFSDCVCHATSFIVQAAPAPGPRRALRPARARCGIWRAGRAGGLRHTAGADSYLRRFSGRAGALGHYAAAVFCTDADCREPAPETDRAG